MSYPVSAEVKKVKPYPFKGEVKDDHGSRTGSIVLLTETGILMDTTLGAPQPGDRVSVSFRLPVLHEDVQFSGVVVKVYNHLAGGALPEGSTSAVAQRLEVHIRAIEPSAQNRIKSFLDQIGQRSRS